MTNLKGECALAKQLQLNNDVTLQRDMHDSQGIENSLFTCFWAAKVISIAWIVSSHFQSESHHERAHAAKQRSMYM